MADDLERVLSTFEERARRVMDSTEKRINRRRRQAAFWDRPALETGLSLSALKPSLDDYDGYQETHGQD